MATALDSTDTPYLLVDLDVLEMNLKEMAQVAADAGVRLRPHVKTHKSPLLAQRQIELGACGITVAKLGEAEVMADAGIRDIRIVYPIVGPAKLERLARLMRIAHVSIALDSYEVATDISDLAARVGHSVPILLEINTGLDRLGVKPYEAIAMAARIASLPHITMVGILTHEGHALTVSSREGARQCAVEIGELMVDTARRLRQEGLPIEEVSVGSTVTARDIAFVPGITEIRPGTYVFNDVHEIATGVADESTCALTVLTTIVSIPAEDRAVVDAGSKTLSSALPGPLSNRGYGLVRGHPDARVDRLSEEHGIITIPSARTRLSIGQHLEIIPNHVCPVVNLADTMYAIRNGTFELEIPVNARGRNR